MDSRNHSILHDHVVIQKTTVWRIDLRMHMYVPETQFFMKGALNEKSGSDLLVKVSMQHYVGLRESSFMLG